MSILEDIVEDVRTDVEREKKVNPIDFPDLENFEKRSLLESIKKESNAPVIGELKRASPSEGLIRSDFEVDGLAISLVNGGVVGISVLTESNRFRGKLEYLRTVHDTVEVPILRKDFIVDEYQLYQAKKYGADAVLLITEVLGDTLPKFVNKSKELELETLVEVRDKDQAKFATSVDADIIGINNRDLRTMEIDLSRTERISRYIPEDTVLLSESGIKNRADVEKILEAGADAVLVGTSIMKSNNVEGKVRELVFGDGSG